MNLNNLDKLEQAEGFIKGLRDTMFYLETAGQDVVIPITVLCPFEAVLEKVYCLLKEIEEKEKENQ